GVCGGGDDGGGFAGARPLAAGQDARRVRLDAGCRDQDRDASSAGFSSRRSRWTEGSEAVRTRPVVLRHRNLDDAAAWPRLALGPLAARTPTTRPGRVGGDRAAPDV